MGPRKGSVLLSALAALSVKSIAFPASFIWSPELKAGLRLPFIQAGMQDRAIDLLRKALDEGFNDTKRLMQDPEFANLRKTAEFAQLMAAEKQP